MSEDHCYVKGQTGLSAPVLKNPGEGRDWPGLGPVPTPGPVTVARAMESITGLAGVRRPPLPGTVPGVPLLRGGQDHRNPVNDIYWAGLS